MKYSRMKYSIKKSVRFRQWSRKGYAAFLSMCYQVSIGHVNKWIADSALGKNECNGSKTAIGNRLIAVYETENEVTGDITPELIGLNVLERNLIPVAAATDHNPKDCIYFFTNLYGDTNQDGLLPPGLVSPFFLLYKHMIDKVKEKLMDGVKADTDDILRVVVEYPLQDVMDLSHYVTRKFASRRFDMCSIINAKSGRCPEDCKWCAQSIHHPTKISEYGIVSEEECIHHALHNERQGVSRFSLVTSGKKPSDAELVNICNIFKGIKQNSSIKLCASLGLASYEQMLELKEAGVERYHCNLETSPALFGSLCSTHTQAQKIETIKAAQKAGMSVCSGGIIGMGESMRDRAELALTLESLGILSIPINLLQPIKGTPLENPKRLDEEEIIRSIALFRLINPKAYLRFAGGRSQMSEEGVKKALYTGINSAIVGDLLTTIGSNINDDINRIKESGYEL